jgi:hypothetical protein
MVRKLTSALIASLLIVAGVVCQPQSSDEKSRPLNMPVLWDSILWGQGLKSEHKFWHQAKLWPEKLRRAAARTRP